MQQLRDQHILLGRFLHYQFSTFQKPLPLFDSPFLKPPLCLFSHWTMSDEILRIQMAIDIGGFTEPGIINIPTKCKRPDTSE